MGKITINELSNSLTDYMDEKQNVEDYSLMTESKTIAGAINEIYGKQLIADTIGEPLSSSDTFRAMSNDINELLNTFKTNMMNNGVTVESGDKFKQLIDKIATLTDNEGKGIQFVEFTTSVSFELNYTNPKYLNINGDYNFKPTHIILNFTEQTSGTPSNHQVITLNTFPGAATTFFSGSSGLSVRIESTEIGSVKLWYNGKGTSSISSYRGYYVHCYLFGVREEDTTKHIAQIETTAGGANTFIVKNDGSLWVCGYNHNGELGLGNENTTRTLTQVTNNINNDVKEVSCGAITTMLLKNDGTLWVCGRNSYGSLAIPDVDKTSTFIQVPDMYDVKHIICGYYFTLAIKNDGSLWACGSNGNGQLGLGDTDGRSTFTQVTTNINYDVKEFYCTNINNENTVFIVKNDGSVWGSGYNQYGRLGTGDTTNKNVFTQII